MGSVAQICPFQQGSKFNLTSYLSVSVDTQAVIRREFLVKTPQRANLQVSAPPGVWQLCGV